MYRVHVIGNVATPCGAAATFLSVRLSATTWLDTKGRNPLFELVGNYFQPGLATRVSN